MGAASASRKNTLSPSANKAPKPSENRLDSEPEGGFNKNRSL